MIYYLLDSSAYIFALDNGRESLTIDFFEEKGNKKAFLYMPQFCVSEVLNTFARKRYAKDENKNITPEQYKVYHDTFLDLVHNRKMIYVYDLHRYHNINAGPCEDGGLDICRQGWESWNSWEKGYLGYLKFKKDKNVVYKRPLSTYDILIVAMAIELKKIHVNDELKVLTRDELLRRVINSEFSKYGVTAPVFDLNQSAKVFGKKPFNPVMQ